MKISKNISLKKYTTIRIGGLAKIIYFPENHNELKQLENVFKKKTTLILGNGSNIAFKDNGYKGDLVCFKKLKKSLSLIGSKNLYASAGVSCARFAKYAHKNEIPGFEFLYGIPGTIGGALCMNAGAFGSEIWDHVEYVTVINSKSQLEKLPTIKFKFSYRKVNMSNIKAFIDVYFKINRKKKFNPDLIYKFNKTRNESQPTNQWSSGCIFKNPTRTVSASSLIDNAGLHRRKIGGIYISKKHCNYFINDGSGTCTDLEGLIKVIQKDIFKKHKIRLQTEICIY